MNSTKQIAKLKKLCRKESQYYLNSIDLIAASNFLRNDLIDLRGYTLRRSMEGNLFRRPYAGTKYLDAIESIGVEAAKKLFKAGMVNIQPHSGSQANQAAYFAFLDPGDKILSLKFDAGGHLTHGHPVNFSGRTYKFEHYGINPKTQTIDYKELEKKTREFKPKLIIAGASSYPRIINYRKIAQIAHKNKALFMADIAHPAGLIAAGLFPSPFPHADIVTTSAEKTLWGPHGGIIMAKHKYEKIINKSVHPGTQSSVPMERIIRISLALLFAQSGKFKKYAKRIMENAKILEATFKPIPNCLLFGGTDSHFIVINVSKPFGLTGKQAEKLLEGIGIFTNRQIIPWEDKKSVEISGLRIGVPAATGRGYKKNDFKKIGKVILDALQNPSNKKILLMCKDEIDNLIKSKKHEGIDKVF